MLFSTLLNISYFAGPGGGGREPDDMLSHVLDHAVIHLPKVFGIDLSITLHTLWMWGVAVLLMILLPALFRKSSLVPRGMANAIEAVVVFLRKDIIENYLGKDARAFEPLILTFFFFVLFNNLVGLVPAGATPTSDLSVTAVLAIITFSTGLIAGMKRNGLFGFWKGLVPQGVPLALIPLIAVLEVMSLFIKHFVLAMRLFANMTAGHIAILSLISIIFIFKSYAVVLPTVLTAVAISLLELLVACLQAYIFTLLSTVFIGAALHQEH
ncbi:MAG: F0F1 ATP synthase subunit A [bacterium]